MATRFLAYPLRLSTAFASFGSTPVHLEMLRDTARTAAFERAIAALVQPGARVVDIGAGSGLLGLWALAAGASHVDAIDATVLGTTLAQTFAANGVAAKTTAHVAHSSQVELTQRADVVIAEVLGHFGIDEGILATCADARSRLAKPGAAFLPARIDVIAWPVWVPDFEDDLVAYWQSSPYGFDLSRLAELSRGMTYLCGEQAGARLADAAALSTHVVGDAPPATWRGKVTCQAAFPSRWNGFFLSFAADLGAGVVLHGHRTSNWQVVFVPAPRVTTLARGDAVTLEVESNADGSVRYRVSS